MTQEAEELLGLRLEPWQREVVDAMVEGRRVVLVGGSCGKRAVMLAAMRELSEKGGDHVDDA